MIPVANPHAAYAARRAEINGAVQTVLNSGRYILGEQVEAFERKFAAWSGAAHCVGCANGTDAIALALHAFGIGGGHAVAVPSFTAVPTVAAIRMVGATPLLLDVEHDHWTLDPVELAEVLDRPPVTRPHGASSSGALATLSLSDKLLNHTLARQDSNLQPFG